MSDSGVNANDGAILILTALPRELRPIGRRLKLRRTTQVDGWPIRHNLDRSLAGAFVGVGPTRAAAAAKHLIDIVQPAGVIVAGYAGGLLASLRTGDIVIPAEVVRADPPASHVPLLDLGITPAGRLLSLDQPVTTPIDKRRLAEASGACAVDMETAAIAGACLERGLRWAAVRAISDTAADRLPRRVATMVRPDGTTSLRGTARQLVSRPRELPAVLTLAIATAAAGKALARHLEAALSP